MATALTLGILAFVFLIVVWAFQRRMMYFPFGDVPPPAQVGLPFAEAVTFATADGLTLHGWFVPFAPSDASAATGEPSARSASRARGTIVVFNGNAGNRAYRAPLANALRAIGFNVLLFDYRGFGDNAGTPTEDGLAADARAARDYVRGRADVDPARIIYFGESLGTGVAVRLAAEHAPAALVLRSPFTSMTDVGRVHYPLLPVRWLLRDRFASIDAIQKVSCPVLVIAGDRDSIIPPDQSRRLHEAVPSSAKELLIIRDADHNDDALLAGREMIEAIDRFLRNHDGRTH